MDKELEAKLTAALTPIIASAATTALVAGAMAAIEALVVTNYHKSDLTGDTEMHPTKDETTISQSETAATSTEGKLSKDEVNAQNGDVKASNMDAVATDSEATALEEGASAVRTKAGASDIETKALKMT